MIIFCSVRIKGRNNIDGLRANAIIASNHTSELDPLLVVASLPFFSPKLPLIFVSREKSFYKNSSLSFIYGGDFFKAMGAYPAYVGQNDYNKALPRHLRALRDGRTVCIFPMGKRHALTDINNAKGGVTFLSVASKKPIVPVKIEGLYKRTTKDFLTRKAKLTITFGEPVYAKDIVGPGVNITATGSREECEAASRKLMEKIAAL